MTSPVVLQYVGQPVGHSDEPAAPSEKVVESGVKQEAQVEQGQVAQVDEK